jgi:hypothetical protein
LKEAEAHVSESIADMKRSMRRSMEEMEEFVVTSFNSFETKMSELVKTSFDKLEGKFVSNLVQNYAIIDTRIASVEKNLTLMGQELMGVITEHKETTQHKSITLRGDSSGGHL